MTNTKKSTYVTDDQIKENSTLAEQTAGSFDSKTKKNLSDKELKALATKCIDYCQQMTGMPLHPYQQEFGWRICYSLLKEDSDEITALFSRQSGKSETVAVVVVGLMVLLPILARHIPWDERITKFKNGLWCGIYAPNYKQSAILWSRMRTRLYSDKAKESLLDPDIDIDLTGKTTENMVLPNGSFVDCETASPQADIEGKTYHLIIMEESQDLDPEVVKASIHPMGAATAASMVKIGTCNKVKSDFYYACRRNKRHDVENSLLRSNKRNHFEFDYTVAQRYNKRYRKYMEKEVYRLGYDSDEFKMKYRLIWMLSRGLFVNEDLFSECEIKTNDNNLTAEIGSGRRKKTVKFVRSPNVVNYDPKTPNMAAAIDFGKVASTVVTVGKVFWDGGVTFGKELRYPIHIQNWLELEGDDHEAQHPEILNFLKNYRISQIVVDATGKGDPIYSRIAPILENFGIMVFPFIFSATSKDIGYKILDQEIKHRRLTFPAGSAASRQQKFKKFYMQMTDLEKKWRGNQLVVSKPSDDAARDDYPDSLMMLSWLVNAKGTMEIEEGPNMMLGRKARWQSSDMLKEAGAWFREKFEPKKPLRQARQSKRGKWD